jgi:hypothetical protein
MLPSMPTEQVTAMLSKTTRRRQTLLVLLALLALSLSGCGSDKKAAAEHGDEEEAESRTEFTDRVENFFEYDRLQAGKASQFLIHLSDLTDGTPVEKADVTLSVRSKGGAEVGQVKAKVGKVTGIYVADVTIPAAGDYDIEFHVRNPKLDERMSLKDFKVE